MLYNDTASEWTAAAVRTAAVVVPSGGGKYRRGVLRPSWELWRASNFGLCFAYAVSHVLQNYAYRSIAILGYLGLLHFAIQRI